MHTMIVNRQPDDMRRLIDRRRNEGYIAALSLHTLITGLPHKVSAFVQRQSGVCHCGKSSVVHHYQFGSVHRRCGSLRDNDSNDFANMPDPIRHNWQRCVRRA